MLDDILNRKPDVEIVEMQSVDCVEISKLHEKRFPRAWSDGEFVSLLSQPSVFGYVAKQTNSFFTAPIAGFVLAREAGGEAEILTIAVNEKYGRSGIGWRLMHSVLREANYRGAETMFLEVDAENSSAVGLYNKLAFQIVAERQAYYTAKDGSKSTALVMRRDLR